jgi:hypothetical protein
MRARLRGCVTPTAICMTQKAPFASAFGDSVTDLIEEAASAAP